MDARLRAASIMRRAMQQATKAARLLDNKIAAAPQDTESTPA
jgi:hypothetical protein